MIAKNKMGPEGEKIMQEKYKEYLKMPKASFRNESEMYDREWCVIMGRSIVHPHPHRHYTYEEFLNKVALDDEFCARFGIN